MRTGKLSEKELNIALSTLQTRGSDVIRGAQIGQDCAVIKANGRILITTDPITCRVGDPYELALTVNANDIYAGGGVPCYAMLTVLAPTDTDAIELSNAIAEAGNKANSQGIEIIGGHTEFTDAVNRLVISVTMVGVYKGEDIIDGNIIAGNKIIVTKALALEGSRIILDNHKELISRFSSNELDELYGYSLSVRDESMILQSENIKVSAMHDITEGGVYGAVCEMMNGRSCGAQLHEDLLPTTVIGRKLSIEFGYDIGRMISSGAMLIIADNADMIVNILAKRGVKSTVIGSITLEHGVKVIKSNGSIEYIQVESDAIYRV